MKAQFGNRYYEDPSIARCCALEYDRLWEAIGERVGKGEWFYRAREIVLAEELPDIGKAFGSVVAQRVSKAIQHTDPEKLPDSARRAAKAHLIGIFEEHLIKTKGKVPWYDRLCLKLTGMPL